MAKPSSSLALAGLSLVLLARPAAAQSAEGAPAPAPSPRAAVLSAAEARAVAWYGTPYVAEAEAPHGAGAVVDGVDLTPDGSRGVTRRFQLFDRLIVTAPAGRQGAVGDSLLLVRRGPVLGTGQVLLPTGIAVVDGIAGSLRTARLVRVYDVVAAEQAVLPLPALPPVDSTLRSSGGRETSIVWIDGGAELPSLQRTVVLAGGAGTSLREGDRLEVVGDGRRIAGGPMLPGTRAAVLRVVRVTPQGASARLESQAQPVVSIGMAARTLP
ncbi:hypothetical protein J421_3556 [Gemmatirosa kalamazoonensis]|uniref:Flagella basal body P-ring formation protein FlgA n=1 Tax=Gemmatirosa kalamazoonensis TaxID=861299 RepID=W0RNQ7_9BACT|nr:hypothetical protein [Gemmatirosa kalamazoonensis]AHG91093.1 hypothetical protein J421_3556 [Gemmatirosa kalamazoonensis]